MKNNSIAHIAANPNASGKASAGNLGKEAWHTNNMIRYFPRSKDEFNNLENLKELENYGDTRIKEECDKIYKIEQGKFNQID